MKKYIFSALVALLTGLSLPPGGLAGNLPPEHDIIRPGIEKTDSLTLEDLSAALNGEWAITNVERTVVADEDNEVYINFEAGRGLFYCSNGCNMLNGKYNVEEGGVIVFSDILSTLRACPNEYSSQISSIISDGSKVHVVVGYEGNTTTLTFVSPAGKQLMKMCRNNMDFMNGQWVVTSINNRPVDDEEANVFFDVDAMTVHGNTGCNYFNGRIAMVPGINNSVSFSEMGVTRMYCEKSAQETAMLVALEQATVCVKGEDSTMLLLDDSGNHVITLRRVEIVR